VEFLVKVFDDYGLYGIQQAYGESICPLDSWIEVQSCLVAAMSIQGTSAQCHWLITV